MVTPAVTAGIDKDLSKDIYEELLQIGYSFGQELGRGAYGAVFECKWTNMDGIEEVIAVKHIPFSKKYEYKPVFRWQTSEERREYEEKVKQKGFWRRLVFMLSPKPKVEVTPGSNLIKKGDKLRTEIQALHRTNHPNVIKMKNILQYYDKNKNPNPTDVLIFMEKADSDLEIKLGTGVIDEPEAQNYGTQIIRDILIGLTHLHSKGIAHLDLKPNNVLVFNDPAIPGGVLLKITDFGLSHLFPIGGSTVKTGITGTLKYCDPIIRQIYDAMTGRMPFSLHGRATISYDALKADIWSYAVVLLQFFVGTQEIENIVSAHFANLKNAYLLALNSITVSEEFKNLFKKLIVDQQIRLSTVEVCEHEWIRDVLAQQRQSHPSFKP